MLSDPTSVSPATPEQLKLGGSLGLDLSADSYGVAAAKLRWLLRSAINVPCGADAATPSQVSLGDSLGVDVRGQPMIVAFAMIRDELLRRNLASLKRLRLKPGDQVVQHYARTINGTAYEFDKAYIVSSIRKDGFVYFKGMNCPCAWASQLTRA